ncbi:unnamed protein product [Ectocarpus sp. 4 AP-2014]
MPPSTTRMCAMRPSVRTPVRRSRGLLHEHPRPTPKLTVQNTLHRYPAGSTYYHTPPPHTDDGCPSTKSTKGHMHARRTRENTRRPPSVRRSLAPALSPFA